MDNVDQNVFSSDGKGILHVMGVVERSTPLSANEARKLPSLPQIPRQKLRKAPDLAQGKGIPILQYEIPEKFGLSKLMFKKMSEITLHLLQPKYLYLDTLWYALRFNPKIDPEFVLVGVGTCHWCQVETTNGNRWFICYSLLI